MKISKTGQNMAQYTPKPKLSQLARQVHENAVRHGFWEETHSVDHYLTLAVCELAEAVEADRAGRRGLPEMKREFEQRVNEVPSPHEAATEEQRYAYWFEVYVKDTVGDELADAVIRLLDLAASYQVDFTNTKVKPQLLRRGWLFTENIWAIINTITDRDLQLGERIVSGIKAINTLALFAGADLWWHVATKMTYNASRPYKHGKKY